MEMKRSCFDRNVHFLVVSQVGEVVEKSGPLCRLGGKVEEIRVGLRLVLTSLEKKSVSVTEAESRQKVGTPTVHILLYGVSWRSLRKMSQGYAHIMFIFNCL